MAKLKEKGIETFELDITQTKSIQDVKEKVAELTDGKLDMLVNNAYVKSSRSSLRPDSLGLLGAYVRPHPHLSSAPPTNNPPAQSTNPPHSKTPCPKSDPPST